MVHMVSWVVLSPVMLVDVCASGTSSKSFSILREEMDDVLPVSDRPFGRLSANSIAQVKLSSACGN